MNGALALVHAAIRRFGTVGLVLAAVGLGLAVPGPGRYADLLVTPLVVFLVYASLRGIAAANVEYGSYGLAVLGSLAVSYLLVPIGGMGLATPLLSGDALTGMAIVLAAPTTAGSAIVWTRFAGGDSELAAIASIASLGVAPLCTPLVLSVLLDRSAAVPVEAIAGDLLVLVGGGVVLLIAVPDRLVSERGVDRGSALAIPLLVYTAVASADVGAIDHASVGAVAAVVFVLLGGGFVAMRVVGSAIGIDRSTYLPLFFTGGLKNLGIALAIAFAYASATVVVVIVTYYVLQQLVGALVSDLG